MLDKWFIEDIKTGLKEADRFVIIDEQTKCDFLKDILENQGLATIIEANSELDELRAKYTIEKEYQNKNVIVFTTIPLDKLKFLREYCETSDCLNITHLHRYIKQKVNEQIDYDLVFPADKIIALGRMSIGKKKDFWNRIINNGDIFAVEDILDFLNFPDKVFKSFSKEEQRLFCDYMSQHTPFSLENKPPQTIANEIATAVFNNLTNQNENLFLDNFYRKWIDSKKFEPVLKKYVAKYAVPDHVDVWKLSVSHPFKHVDESWLKQITEHISDLDWIKNKLPIIKQRAGQSIAKIIGIHFWKDIYQLFIYDSTHVNDISSLNDAIVHYQKYFYKVDKAIRHLYTTFMSEKSILRPIQEYYQQVLSLYLDKWFAFFADQYEENQTGLLKQIIEDHEPPISIIVGDAISYEVAQEIIHGIGSEYKIQNGVICGNFPSETENNMGSLFTTAEDRWMLPDKREKLLLDETNQKIGFLNLDELSVAHKPGDYTLFYSRDVDQLSEKQNQTALKYYEKFIDDVQEKIATLFGCGNKKVFLISDHGFVLTGILEESDKININVPDGNKSERYCVSKNKVSGLPNHVFEIQKRYKEYEYLYFSKCLNPFKTKGAYGFSHGGVCPQELLIPYLQIEKIADDYNQLEILIINKEELKSAVGDSYQIKIKAGPHAGDAFSSNRKIIIVFVKDKTEFNHSDIIQIDAEKEITREFVFGEQNEFEIIIVDAESKVRLDTCKVKKQIARDLGGLGGNR